MTDRLRAVVRGPSLWLFLLLLALYSLTQGGEFFISDGEVMFQTTLALADGTGLGRACDPGLPQIVPGVGGQCFSKYGLGTPLLATLFYLFARLLAHTVLPAADAVVLGHFFVASMNVVLTAATGLVFFRYARALYDSRWLGLILALLYGVTTSAWPYSKFFFSEPLVAFLTVLAAYALFCLRPGTRAGLGWAALAGAALGYAVFAKVAALVLVPLFGLYLLWRLLRPSPPREEPAAPRPAGPPDNFVRIGPRLAARQAGRRPSRRVDPDAINRFPVPLRTATRPATRVRELVAPASPAPVRLAGRALLTQLVAPLVAFALPLAAFAALVLWHNAVRFGSVFNSGYSDEGFTTPFYVGLYGLLFSTGKSVFLFSPIVLLGIPGLVWLWRRHRAEALLAGGVALITLVYYAPWWAWYGGWSWGPRFLVPALPFLVLPIGALLLERRWSRPLAAGLAVVGIGVQILGAVVDFNPYIVEIVADNPDNEARYIFYPWLSPLIGHLRYLVKGHHLAVATFDMTRLGFSHRFALIYPSLVVGTLLLAAAALISIYRPRRRPVTGRRP